MGNILKAKTKRAHANNSLNRSLLSENLIEQIRYLNDKLDMLDDKLFVMEAHTRANLEVISSDIHLLNKKLNNLK